MKGKSILNLKSEILASLFTTHRELLTRNDPPAITALREEALRSFVSQGFPTTRMEGWRQTDLRESLRGDYSWISLPETDVDVQKVFRCNIPQMDTAMIGLLNGWYVSKDVPLMKLGNGIIMGSLAEAMKQYPELVAAHLGRYASFDQDSLSALNTALFQDGVFICIPDDVRSPRPVQIINVIQHPDNIFLQSRNLIILGKNSSLTLVHCDDSYNEKPGFSNIVTEIVMDRGARLDHYKLQNLNNNKNLVSRTVFHLEEEADLESHFITLNGGLVRNNVVAVLNGSHARADIYGLYLMDRRQHIDNQVNIDHRSPDCTSSTHFKGVMDEQSTGVFNGHVLVRRDAARTSAYQSNRNILLTESAKVFSKPFLEIYNDDVKCSHGSTTGQLDPMALFYLRQRGIGEESARMLLMYAFADEVIRKIAIEPLRSRIEDMVKKRLQGELQICEQCVLHCTTPEKPVEFEIDLGRV